MRKFLQDIEKVENFIHDVIFFTDTFEEHLLTLKVVLERLRAAGLTTRSTKFLSGFEKIDRLGHLVSNHWLEPEMDKIKAVRNAHIYLKQRNSFIYGDTSCL